MYECPVDMALRIDASEDNIEKKNRGGSTS